MTNENPAPCDHPIEVVGPFPQTLYLGCSIQKFTHNLGWGAEPSTCSVSLVIDPIAHPNDSIYSEKTASIDSSLNTGTNNATSNAFTGGANAGTDQPLHRNILKKMKDAEAHRKKSDITGESNPNRKDNGKKIWKFKQNAAVNHTKRDLGFLADDFGLEGDIRRRIDILGTLTQFRFDNTIFNGIIKTWSYHNGTIDVQIQSPTNLVKNTKLILNNFRGSISTLVPGSFDGVGIAVPFDDPAFAGGGHNATIYNGNVPNLINIFGYAGFSQLGYAEDRGVSLGRVYDFVREMLAANSNPDQFNTYGGIVAKNIRDRESGAHLDPATDNIVGIGGPYDLSMYNTINCVAAPDSFQRPILDFDINDVPRPPNGVYISDSSISLVDFIDRCCEPVGMDYYFELLPSSNTARSATVKVRTISRRFQPSLDLIRDKVTGYQKSDFVTDAKFGQEFQDAKTRTVVLGGNQKRLYQAGTNNLGRYRHRRVYEPSLNNFINFDFNAQNNIYRIPDTSNYRNLVGQAFYNIGGAVVGQETANNFGILENSPFNQQQFYRGSYQPMFQYLPGQSANNPIFGRSSYFLGQNDIIKPYFGKDLYGNHRGVSFNQALGETFLNVNTADLAAVFPANDAPSMFGSIDVSETEIRCAMAGVDSWLNYIFEMPVLGKPLGMATYIYNYMSQKFGGPFASNFFLNALNIFSADKGKIHALPAVTTAGPINVENYLPYSEALWPALSSLHNFFADIGNTHYGQSYMVQLPFVTSYVDGNGIRRYSYEVTDKAWEEPLNYIDDTIQIGGDVANSLANEDGTFGAIVGYDASAEYDAVVGATDLNNPFGPGVAGTMLTLGRNKNPANWYWPLRHNIPRADVYYMPYSQQQSVLANISLPEGFPIINPTFPGSTSAHGKAPPSDGYKWKMYTRATIEDAYPEAQYNQKLTVYYGKPHCILNAPSQVMVESPTQLLKTMMEEILIWNGINNRNSYAYLIAWSIAEHGLRQTGSFLAPPMGNQQNLPIAPRAAVPVFAAVPLKSNLSSYGPWSSHPGLGYANDNSLFAGRHPISQINNLVGEVNFEHKTDAVPENYGGIHALDDSILTTLKDNNQYQQVLENGSITTAGVMFLNTNLGSQLVANGPLVNAITVSIGSQGMTTTYSMRTYNRKIGFYNKSGAENIQRVNRQAIESRQQVNQAIKNMINKSTAGKNSNVYSQPLAKGLSYSPVSVVAGMARPFLHGNSSLTKDVIFDGDIAYTPAWNMRPNLGNNTVSPSQHLMHKDSVMLYDEQEMSDLLTSEYDRRAFMSLDGLLSPISFYPTPYTSTYPITLFNRDSCPYCAGRGTYTYEQMTPPGEGESGGTSTGSTNAKAQKNMTCPFCTTSSDKGQSSISKPAYSMPPSILTDTTDDGTDYSASDMVGAPINRFTLNPIVMSQGEFNVGRAKQSADACGHAIDVVGFGQSAPAAGSSLRSSTAENIDNNYAGNVNQRFFGLRGPIMVHGWGYDTDGYPVPNKSGELKVVDGNVMSVTQTIKSDGTITEPYRTKEFYKGWAQQPGTWPVGPIDLRWDTDAGVWTIGNQYKNVWVTIEIDLVGTQPTRGTIFGLTGSDDALPAGKRRLVFVRDSVGSFAAPRGASIYCSYDPDSGFYTPLYNTPVVTSGKLESDSSAMIYQSYSRGYSEDPSQRKQYSATFKNPLLLNVNVGSLGLFGYINGYWVLQNVK